MQRRSLVASKDFKKGDKISIGDLEPLRPFLKDSFEPFKEGYLIGKTISTDILKGTVIKLNHISI